MLSTGEWGELNKLYFEKYKTVFDQISFLKFIENRISSNEAHHKFLIRALEETNNFSVYFKLRLTILEQPLMSLKNYERFTKVSERVFTTDGMITDLVIEYSKKHQLSKSHVNYLKKRLDVLRENSNIMRAFTIDKLHKFIRGNVNFIECSWMYLGKALAPNYYRL